MADSGLDPAEVRRLSGYLCVVVLCGENVAALLPTLNSAATRIKGLLYFGPHLP